ncbi:MAG: hypothetical protein R2867_42590 [Caldilineaceae bacterium]
MKIAMAKWKRRSHLCQFAAPDSVDRTNKQYGERGTDGCQWALCRNGINAGLLPHYNFPVDLLTLRPTTGDIILYPGGTLEMPDFMIIERTTAHMSYVPLLVK